MIFFRIVLKEFRRTFSMNLNLVTFLFHIVPDHSTAAFYKTETQC